MKFNVAGPPPAPLKNHKTLNMGFLSKTGLDPSENHKNYQASIQYWATSAHQRIAIKWINPSYNQT